MPSVASGLLHRDTWFNASNFPLHLRAFSPFPLKRSIFLNFHIIQEQINLYSIFRWVGKHTFTNMSKGINFQCHVKHISGSSSILVLFILISKFPHLCPRESGYLYVSMHVCNRTINPSFIIFSQRISIYTIGFLVSTLAHHHLCNSSGMSSITTRPLLFEPSLVSVIFSPLHFNGLYSSSSSILTPCTKSSTF